MLHFVEKEWEQARACFETSLEKKDVTGYKFGVAWSLLNKGDLNRKQKRWNSALECYDQSLCIAREIGSRYIEAKGLVALCSVAHFKEAPLEELAAEAEAIATQHEYYDQLAELRYLQAGVYLKQMRQQKAFATYADSCVCALLYNVYFLDKIVKQIVQEVNSLRQHSQCEECRALVEYLILYWQNGSVEGNLLEEVERAKRLQEDHGKQQLSLVERLQDVLVEVKGN
jgi:tetratricopeptide (TPR) repeat protein